MPDTIPNVQLTAWREARVWSRAQLANALNRTDAGVEEGLNCDEERVRRWEKGEVLWPHAPYRRALEELTNRSAEQLGFIPPHLQKERRRLLVAKVIPQEAMKAEADLFDTMELARLAERSDIGPGTIESIEEAVDLLCRAYPVTQAPVLATRTKQRLQYVLNLVKGSVTLTQHRDLLVQAGWLAALLGCLHYDMGQRELAEAARQGAWQFGRQTGHGELMGWACEMACWFAITEGRFEDVLEFAHKGQAVAGTSSAMVQLTLQEAKAYARMGSSFAQEARDALETGAHILGQLPTPSRPEHHFVFDHTKWIYYASTVYTWQGDNARAEEHAIEIITRHTRANGSTDSPMRVAGARIDLALLHARHRDLDGAVEQGLMAFEYDRRSLGDLVARGNELADELTEHFPGEPLTDQYHERLHVAQQALIQQRPELLA